MIPIEQLTKEQAAGIRYILTDIDDTITTEGKLPACAYTAMWRLHDAGYKVIPVTGRSCGWCDLIAREWPQPPWWVKTAPSSIIWKTGT